MVYIEMDSIKDIVDFSCSFKIKPEYISFIKDDIYKKDFIKDYGGDLDNVPLQYRELILIKFKTGLNNFGHWQLDESNNKVSIGMYFYQQESYYDLKKKLEKLVRYLIIPISTKIYECLIKHNYSVEDKWNLDYINLDELKNNVFYFYNKIDKVLHNLDDNGNIISTTIKYKYPIDVDNTELINKKLFKLH